MVLIDISNTDTFTQSNGYYIHQYTTPGTRTITVPDGGVIEVLVVAGGGGGASASGQFLASGGGGGGEVVHLTSHTIRGGNVTVTVGGGGAGGASNTNGSNSVFGSITANGGGAGGTTTTNAGSGGSGGGCGRNNTTRALSVKLYPTGLGNNGGVSVISGAYAAAGGGGASSAGTDVTGQTGTAGGAGYSCSITGIAQIYGSGGGGGARAGPGGVGGSNAGNGGRGETQTYALLDATSAMNGFGGGGGGGGCGGVFSANVGAGGAGGSGTVIVKYYTGANGIIYKPVYLSQIKNVLVSTSNAFSLYKNQKVQYKGIYNSLPSSTIAYSDFADRSKSVVSDGLAVFYDPASSACYPGSGTTLTDLSGNNRNGTLQGTSTVSSNQQLVFNGPNVSYVSTAYTPNFDGKLYTLECWFNDDSAGGFTENTALVSTYPNSTQTVPVVYLHIFTSGQARFLERNSGGTARSIYTPSSVCNGTWTHLAAVANATDIILYVNGVSVGTQPRAGGTITSGRLLIIGGHHFDRYQTCRMGPVRVYLDKALSAAEVVQNYEAERYRESLNV